MDLNNLKAASTITVNLAHFSTFEPLDGFSVTCHAPGSLKYRTALLVVAKKHASADGKKFIDMDVPEIERAISTTIESSIDMVREVVVGCSLVNGGEKLTVDGFKQLIGKGEYSWIVQQVKAALDSGKLEPKRSEIN